ncbi:MAG TPA: GntG family PLP-dependent aldolase [Acidimicrobiales bacterium]|jgi:threonine aldolase
MTGDQRFVDLRSDTVTRPTAAMRSAMAEAEVGDDQYGEDPSVNRLQARYAELVGKEAALFVPSGIMANQLAVKVLSRPGTAVVAGRHSHIVAYEEGAAAIHSGVLLHALDDADGRLDPVAVAEVVDGVHHHLPEVSAVCVEDTHMPSNGSVWPLEDLQAVSAVGPPMHLDGARLWNAVVASGEPADRRARDATTVMSCLSKGLGAPVGSVLAGPADLIDEARRFRRMLGGAMRQAGVLAAAGLHAFDHHIERLAEDHRRAGVLARAVEQRWPDAIDVGSVTTNIVTFRPADPAGVVAHLAEHGVKAGTIAPDTVRMVTHLDVDDAGMERALAALASAP